MSYIIAIANEKGGVAKTTTTLSLGASLVESGNEVLLIDLDAQANLSLALAVDPISNYQSTSNVFLDGTSPTSISRETGIPGLDLIPSNQEMVQTEKFLHVRPNYETILQNALRTDPNMHYKYIILDCPPFLGSVTFNALAAADMLLIPTQPEFFSVHALKSMLSLVRTIRNKHNPRLTYRLLITMLDRRNRTHRNMGEQLRSTFGTGLLNTTISTDTKLRESPIAGMPIIYYAPKSRAAQQYRSLAEEINQYVKETTEQPA